MVLASIYQPSLFGNPPSLLDANGREINRVCRQCGECKPLDQFACGNKRSKNGKRHLCKPCLQAIDRARALARTPTPLPEKACARCGAVKPIGEFPRNARHADGYLNRCKECERQRVREAQTGNADHLAKRRARYRAHEYRAANWRYVSEHREAYRKYARDYLARNYQKAIVQAMNRQARKMTAEGRFTVQDVLRLLVRQDGRCAYCGTEVGGSYHVDHRRPLSRGGSNWPDNLAIACAPCNQQKYNKTVEEYLAWRLAHELPGFPLDNMGLDGILA